MTRDIRQRVTDQTLVECQGIEPCRPPCKGGMLPLSSAPHYWHQCKDLNPRRTVLETGMLPLHHTDRIGLGGRIRTCGPLRPRQVRYQTSPHLDNGFRATRVPSTLPSVSRRNVGALNGGGVSYLNTLYLSPSPYVRHPHCQEVGCYNGDLGEAQTRFSS